MCFDYQSSFFAWGASTGAAWYLYNRNKNYDRWNASFITCFSTIQLLEAGIWKTNPETGKPTDINKLLTKLVLMGLTAQPLVQSYAGYKFTHQPILWYLSWIFAGFFLWSMWRILSAKPSDFYSFVGEGGHLIWETEGSSKTKSNKKGSIFGHWGFGILYLAGLFIPLLFMKKDAGIPLLMVGVGTALYSLFVAKPREFGSMWCYSSVIYSIAAIYV